ncbi:protoporphyrinogen oxidase [Persicirhabdus sediminis]|uniref:Coproporphyrinogen III oxidase n=1 Tax=Persicirhabdus sediminis TaxID=454144 RepID=A0A8J7SNA8_9BACT|nr:protoporphyrinogen oxidase [Persicirhabdus sediminis]MBK1792595.1 protoporphyrinogen oxidase [Persicirhabdus sediminis]
MRDNVAVIGAGISGLSAAVKLFSKGHEVDVFEAGERIGGAVRTSHSEGYMAEHGPNSLLLKDQRVSLLLEQIGLMRQEVVDANPLANKRYIVQDGQAIAMPSSPMGMLKSPLFSGKGKLRFALEPFIGKYKGAELETFADFVTRRLGPDMLASAAGPFVSGIYAGDPDRLAIKYAFPRLWNLEDKYGSFIRGAIAMQLGAGGDPNKIKKSRMISFRRGMQALPEAMAEFLAEDTVITKAKVLGIKKQDGGWQLTISHDGGEPMSHVYKHIVIAVPHHKLAEVPIENVDAAALPTIVNMDTPPVTSLFLGFKKSQCKHELDGFGMLVKLAEKSPILGALFSSTLFEKRAPKDHIAITTMMGGMRNPQFAQLDDDELLETALAELRKILKIEGNPTFMRIQRWDKAIPQYTRSYPQVLQAIEKIEANAPGIHLLGNYRGGISVGDCLVNGIQLAEKISS